MKIAISNPSGILGYLVSNSGRVEFSLFSNERLSV